MPNRTCDFPECGRSIYSAGLCRGHHRQRCAGVELAPIGARVQAPADGLCTVEGCLRPYNSRGYCRMHLGRLYRGADIGGAELKNKPYESLGELFERNGWTERVVQPELGPCWEWNGNKFTNGYGQANLVHNGKRNHLVHRLAYEHWHGDIPKGMVICHRCDNPPCMNPDHLFSGSHKQNTQDMVAKGRHGRGGRQPASKLTEQSVREARAAYATGKITQDALARAYGVSQPTMSLVLRGKKWAHVE